MFRRLVVVDPSLCVLVGTCMNVILLSFLPFVLYAGIHRCVCVQGRIEQSPVWLPKKKIQSHSLWKILATTIWLETLVFNPPVSYLKNLNNRPHKTDFNFFVYIVICHPRQEMRSILKCSTLWCDGQNQYYEVWCVPHFLAYPTKWGKTKPLFLFVRFVS
jgi:hypothetical protein